jgi:hypothetical protein
MDWHLVQSSTEVSIVIKLYVGKLGLVTDDIIWTQPSKLSVLTYANPPVGIVPNVLVS